MNSPAMPGSRRSGRRVRLVAAPRWRALVVVFCVLSSFPTVGAAAAERQSTGTTLRSEVWRSTARSAPATVPEVDPEPVGRADPFIDGDVRCSWEGHILADTRTRATEQRERCDAILAVLRPARAFVDRLVGISTSRGIELIVLNDPINTRADVAAQSTSVRVGTVACYPAGQFGDDPNCGGLPPDGPLVSSEWTCQIQVSGDFLTRNESVQRSTLAHEYFHCHQRERSSRSVTTFFASGGWLIEGSAGWVGEAYARGSDISAAWWVQAVQGSAADRGRDDRCPASAGPPIGCIFGRRRGYSAHSFFFALAARRGDATVAGAVLAAVAANSDDAAAMATLAAPTDPVWLQWAGFARGWARGGPSWKLDAPGNNETGRQHWRRELSLGSGPQVSVEARPTENKIADVSWQPIRRGEQHMVVDLEGFALLRWIRDDGNPVGPEVAVQGGSQRIEVCIQGCRSGATPRPPDGANGLVVAVAGTGSTTSRARVSVACPEPTSSSSSPIDALTTSSPISRCCLVGDWVMSQAPSYARFRTLGGGTGQTMTIEPDGRLVADYDPMIPWEVQDSSGPEGGTVVMKLNGRATATIDLERLVSARRLRKVDTDFSGVTVTASVGFGSEGTLDLGTQPFSEWFGIVVAIAGEPPPETNVGLECSASTLRLTDSASGISHEFQRVSEPVCDGRSCSTGGRDPA